MPTRTELLPVTSSCAPATAGGPPKICAVPPFPTVVTVVPGFGTPLSQLAGLNQLPVASVQLVVCAWACGVAVTSPHSAVAASRARLKLRSEVPAQATHHGLLLPQDRNPMEAPPACPNCGSILATAWCNATARKCPPWSTAYSL